MGQSSRRTASSTLAASKPPRQAPRGVALERLAHARVDAGGAAVSKGRRLAPRAERRGGPRSPGWSVTEAPSSKRSVTPCGRATSPDVTKGVIDAFDVPPELVDVRARLGEGACVSTWRASFARQRERRNRHVRALAHRPERLPTARSPSTPGNPPTCALRQASTFRSHGERASPVRVP